MLRSRLAGVMVAGYLLVVTALAAYKPEILLRVGLALSLLYLTGLIFGCRKRARYLPGLLIPGVMVAGAWAFGAGLSPRIPLLVVGAVGAVISLLAAVRPRWGQWIFETWTEGSHPTGWSISRLLLGAVYYLVFTPAGVIMRLIGRDPMHRRFDPAAESYWLERKPRRELESYFRQF